MRLVISLALRLRMLLIIDAAGMAIPFFDFYKIFKFFCSGGHRMIFFWDAGGNFE